MNEIIKNITERRSVRKYLATPVPQEAIEQIALAGEYAASGRGRQSAMILAVTNEEVVRELSAINAKILGREGSDPFFGAPAVMVVLAEKDVPTHVYDGSLVMGNMMNAAHALGLGSCWVHRAKETFELPEGRALLERLGIEGEYEGIGNLVVGYPAETPEAKPRKQNYVYYVK